MSSRPDGVPDVSVVLAAFNEEDSIGPEIERISRSLDASGFSWELLVVDDASTDRTAERAAASGRVRLLSHPVNLGSGSARKTGTEAARGRIVVWTDADMTYPNERIPELVRFLEEKGYAQVVGARTSEQGTHKALRVPAKWFVRSLASFLAGREIPDLNSGLRAFRRDVAMRYLHLLPPGFSCVSTMTLAFLCNSHPVGYLPIDYAKRVGRSKFHPGKDAFRYALQVVRMITFYNPLKVFLPAAAVLLVLAIANGAVDLYLRRTLEEIDVILAVAALLVAMIGLLADLIVAHSKR
ncbi:MAG: glycosyltransferase family 2 protein [Planctomycetes bacterium]|nr:glycosyltransferase family 2 protein [Planctomycetota bacterium]